jgi:hypothetical protein
MLSSYSEHVPGVMLPFHLHERFSLVVHNVVGLTIVHVRRLHYCKQSLFLVEVLFFSKCLA